ncbi:MAG: N-acetyltransferase [Elusimicrobia bacterium]|nr:N-acetyltransferase [Elusimicrobiota bacterium]
MPVEVSSVPEEAISSFIDVPYALNKNLKHWVPEPKSEVRALLSPAHPFWKHGRRRLFIARRNGVPAGCVAAIINDAHNRYYSDKCGFFGFFETADDAEVSSALLGAASAWLKEQGMDEVRGPMNPSTNESCGLLIDGFDSEPLLMMPYNPPYYAAHIENAGFAKVKDLLAFWRDAPPPLPERVEKIIARAVERNKICLRPINLKKFDSELAAIKDIYVHAWSENWGFVPVTDEEFSNIAKSFKPILKPEYVCMLEVDGKPAAFSFAAPDLNQAFAVTRGSLNPLNIIPFLLKLRSMNRGRLLMLGVKNEFRGKGLELVLIKQVIENSRKLGWTGGELSWILEDNFKIINVMEAVGCRLYKRYRIYSRSPA